MMKLVLAASALAGVALGNTSTLGLQAHDQVMHLGFTQGDKKAEEAFDKIYEHFLSEFDIDSHEKVLQMLEVGLENYKNSNAYTAYKTIPGQPVCDRGVVPRQVTTAMGAKAVSAFPGGILKRLFGFDLGQLVYGLAMGAAGPAAASGGLSGILMMQALAMGAGMIQSLVASAIHIIPPYILGGPLTCLPMITGHNCFGAVLYPITMADFVIADVTDSMMDGYIAGFPSTYAQKVGKTSDAMYKLCFSAYMSMMCSSIFPKCTKPASSDIPTIGRAMMCFTACIATLVMCPGYWIEDILGPCQMVAAPPMCSQAIFWNMWKLPPQYVTFEQANPPPMSCPQTDFGMSDASGDYSLYDTGADEAEASPFLEAAEEGSTTGVVKVPNA